MIKRIPWSTDGTKVWYSTSTTTGSSRSELSLANKQLLDSEPIYADNAIITVGANQHWWLCLNFGSPVKIYRVGFGYGAQEYSQNINFQTSDDTTNGYDGTWTTQYNITQSAPYYHYDALMLDMNAQPETRWFRMSYIDRGQYNASYFSKFLLYGTQVVPRHEFWEADESAELVAYPNIDLVTAFTYSIYSEKSEFKIKNVDTVAHSYNVAVSTQKSTGDTVIANYFTVSDDDGASKSQNIDIGPIASGGFSDVLAVFGDMLPAQNPYDGYHYYKVLVTETA